MSVETFDLVVIGSGPAGEKGAAQAAYFGKRVALVEKEPHLGGAGINTGTIPSKTLRETALYLSGILQRGLYGVDYSIKGGITIPEFMHRKDEVVRNLWRTVEANIHRHHIELVRGRASFEDPRAIRVAAADRPDRILSAPVILVATGSYPNWPDGVVHDPRLYDSDSILRMERLPRSLLVVGSGVIGCEYATIFRALGIEVRLLGGQDRLLPFLDAEISERLRLQMELMGLDVLLSDSMTDVQLGGKDVAVVLKSGRVVEAEAVLFATGRMGATQGLALERAGLTAGRRGHLTVNAHYQTAVPHVYAAGDVVGFPALASTSMEQARVAMCHAFDLKYKDPRVSRAPHGRVHDPRDRNGGGDRGIVPREEGPLLRRPRSLQRQRRGQIIGDMSGLVKLVFSCEDRRVLGVHVLGELASELIHLGQSWLLFRRHDRQPHRLGVQLPDPGRGLQVRRIRRPREPGEARRVPPGRHARVTRRGPRGARGAAAASLAAGLLACGGGPASPTSSGGIQRTVTVLAGDTGRPVAGAAVVLGTVRTATDAAGQAILSLADGAPLEIDASGFFVRSTLFRGETTVFLWPIRADAGEDFVAELVYNRLVSDGSVTRPVSPVVLVLSPEVRGDAAAASAEERAAALASAVTGGQISFSVGATAPPGTVAIQVSVDPGDAFLAANPGYGAVTRVTFPGNRITAGSTTYRGLTEARALSVAHETGHVLGLGHPSQPGLMSVATTGRYSDFTPAEALQVRMMQLRLPGNRPPDDDRGVTSSSRGSATVACVWEP